MTERLAKWLFFCLISASFISLALVVLFSPLWFMAPVFLVSGLHYGRIAYRIDQGEDL